MESYKQKTDLEQGDHEVSSISINDGAATNAQFYDAKPKHRVWRWLANQGVEVRGIEPVPLEERVKTNFYNIFFMWTSIMCNLLP